MRLLTLASLAVLTSSAEEGDPGRLDSLDAALVSYFQADSAEVRAELAARVAALPGVGVQAVAERLPTLPLWLPAKPGTTSFEMEAGSGGRRNVWVRIPPGYDPADAWPVMIALHGMNGQARRFLDFAVGLLGERADRMIVAAPQAELSGPYNPQNESETDQPIRLLRVLRRRYHVDSDRVFLTGYSKGAHRTCSASVMFADQWAGAMPLAGSMMPLPQREGLYSYFLPNLNHLPMLMIWGELDDQGPSGKPGSGGGIVSANRRLAQALERMQVPITLVELPGVGHLGVCPSPAQLAALLGSARQRYPPDVSHCFRFPGQGRAYWLKLVEFAGQPWEDDRLQIDLRPGEEAREALLRAIRRRLGRLKGKIEGQLITIHTKKVKTLDVLLHDALIDLDKPITIRMNGRLAFRGMVERRVQTLLELAAEEGDFERVFSARVRIAIGRRGRQR